MYFFCNSVIRTFVLFPFSVRRTCSKLCLFDYGIESHLQEVLQIINKTRTIQQNFKISRNTLDISHKPVYYNTMDEIACD